MAADNFKFLKPAQSEWQELKPDLSSLTGDDKKKAEEKARSGSEVLREMLLTSLQMPNLIVLAGSGTSLGAAEGPSMWDLWDHAINKNGGAPKDAAREKREDAEEVITKIKYKGPDNIEALLSLCDAYLQINEDEKEVKPFVEHCKKTILDKCTAFLQGDSVATRLAAHGTFLHRLSRRRVRDPRLKVFTTNYDLCFERAAAQQGLIPVDGFSFTHPRFYDSRFFGYDIVRRSRLTDEHGDYLEGVFHLLKLHGSVNWARAKDQTLVEKMSPLPSEACLIYPVKGKYQQSYLQPHLELMSQYLASVREPNTCLIVIGYGFNDDHLSEPILAAVRTNPHLRLIVVDIKAEEGVSKADHYWDSLGKLANNGEDVWLINASFQGFTNEIPDLKSLTPARLLEKTIKNIKSTK